MSTASKIGVAIVTIIGAVVLYGFLVHIMHFLVIAALVIGVLFVAGRVFGVPVLGGSKRKSLL